LLLFGEYRQMQRSEQGSSSSSRSAAKLVEETGRLDSANVISHKRTHRPTNYAALSREVPFILRCLVPMLVAAAVDSCVVISLDVR
jgi:hypothetical protein